MNKLPGSSGYVGESSSAAYELFCKFGANLNQSLRASIGNCSRHGSTSCIPAVVHSRDIQSIHGHNRKQRSCSLLQVLVLFLLVTGVQTVSAEIDKSTLWRDAVVTVLDVDFAGTGFHARWQFHRCHCGDLRVQVEQIAPDGMLTGELLMVGGQVLLSRGFEGQGENITPLMQAPVLMLQLADAILNRSESRGPHAVSTKQKWDVEEDKMNFNLHTGFATGTFAAPWRVDGSGWRAESGHRRFELNFQFTIPMPDNSVETSSIDFTGDLDYRKQGFPYPESTVLDGWKIQRFAIGEDESILVSDGLTLKKLREEL